MEGRGLEMVVHPVGAGQQLGEVLEANVQGDRHADSGPQGVASAHPVPELKHVGLVNAELLHL